MQIETSTALWGLGGALGIPLTLEFLKPTARTYGEKFCKLVEAKHRNMPVLMQNLLKSSPLILFQAFLIFLTVLGATSSANLSMNVKIEKMKAEPHRIDFPDGSYQQPCKKRGYIYCPDPPACKNASSFFCDDGPN